ncbi:MAG TPA: hypothetical protein VGG39_10580 [Polyangiaceae bacterium]
MQRRCLISSTNGTTFRDRCRNAIAGVQKDLASVTKVTLNGVDYTPTTLVALLQSGIDAFDAAATARAAWLEAVQKQRALLTLLLGVLVALKSYLTNQYGSAAVAMQADFGFASKKKVVRTSESKTDAAKKATATKAVTHPKVTKQTTTVLTVVSPASPTATAMTTTNPTPAATPQAPATTKS